MFKFGYAVYAVVVLVACTITNLNYAGAAGSTSSGWNSHSSGFAWGGSGGSTGGFSGGIGHK